MMLEALKRLGQADNPLGDACRRTMRRRAGTDGQTSDVKEPNACSGHWKEDDTPEWLVRAERLLKVSRNTIRAELPAKDFANGFARGFAKGLRAGLHDGRCSPPTRRFFLSY